MFLHCYLLLIYFFIHLFIIYLFSYHYLFIFLIVYLFNKKFYMISNFFICLYII
jgi:hypothetical protein